MTADAINLIRLIVDLYSEVIDVVSSSIC